MLVNIVSGLFLLGVTYACCPSGWLVHDGSCYLFSQQAATFWDAERFCKHYHGILVNIGTQTENRFVQSFANAMKDHFYFIGLTDLTKEGEYRWNDTNEVASFIDWAPGQPDGHASQNCMALTSRDGYKWHDAGCDDPYQYICEVSQNPEIEIVG